MKVRHQQRDLFNPACMTGIGVLMVLGWWILRQRFFPAEVFGKILAPLVRTVGYGFFGSDGFAIVVLPLVWMAILREWQRFFDRRKGKTPDKPLDLGWED